MTLAIICGVALLAVLYIANESTDTESDGIEAKSGMDLGSLNVGGFVTMLDTSPEIHGWSPGYDPDPSSQDVVKPRLRYPTITGANVSCVIHRGFDAMRFPGIDGEWATAPPSEVSL
jgi:hypothetical protein